MNKIEQAEIKKISKAFAKPFEETIGKIAGSGWLIVDPLSAYLNFSGFENTVEQIPETKEHPLVLIITFKDGTKFIPAGSDLKHITDKVKDWMFI